MTLLSIAWHARPYATCAPTRRQRQFRSTSHKPALASQGWSSKTTAVALRTAIESAAALLEAPRIAKAAERLIGVMFGSEDFALDLGLPTKREGEAGDLLYARSATVIAAASARKLAFDGIWPDIRDAAGLRADSLRARRLGFSGKTLVHPDQIAVANEVFSPTAAEVEEARRIVRAFDEALGRGDGAVALDGQMLDAPVVDRARRVLRATERNSRLVG